MIIIYHRTTVQRYAQKPKYTSSANGPYYSQLHCTGKKTIVQKDHTGVGNLIHSPPDLDGWGSLSMLKDAPFT